MYRNACMICLVTAALAGLGCSSQQSGTQSKKVEIGPHTIQGIAQVVGEAASASDSALNAGGSSVYLKAGPRRYRLFLKTPAEFVHGREYVAEGVYAQQAIDEIGDPDQGKNGFPLRSSCERVVKMAWGGLVLDELDAQAEVVRATVRRYPGRPLFLVTRIRPVEEAAAQPKKDAAAGAKIPELTVAPEKQRALLKEGSLVQTAPLFDPAAASARCKVLIDPEGKVSDLETGAQLCENVDWSKFRYQPTLQGGRPAKVRTEVELTFEPRK